MSIDPTAAASAAAAALPGQSAQAGSAPSAGDAGRFDAAMRSAEASASAPPSTAGVSGTSGVQSAQAPGAIPRVAESFMGPLERLNAQAREIGEYARSAMTKGRDLTSGEMVMMTVRCHEFMFTCQLTSNIANRTSDGVQQLFKQQS